MNFPTHSDAHINMLSQMKVVKQRGSLIIHKKDSTYNKGLRRYKEERVSIYLHDVIFLFGVAIHLLMCKINLKL